MLRRARAAFSTTLPTVTGAVALLATLGASCPEESSTEEAPRCLPGESRACQCADGRSGRQVCASDGRSVGECECSGAAAPADAAPAGKQAPSSPVAPAPMPVPAVAPRPPEVPLPPAPPAGPAAEAVTSAPGADAAAMVLYRFDEGQGEAAADAGSGGLHAKVASATWTAGRFGRGLLFDGQRSIVRPSGPISMAGATGLTMEAWVRPESSRSMQVFHASDGLALELRSRDAAVEAVLQLAVGGTQHTLASGSALALWQWHHVAGTHDGAVMRIWVDGRLDGELAAAGAVGPPVGCEAPAIGATCRGDGGWFHGGIDEVRVSTMVRYLAPQPETPGSVASKTPSKRGTTAAGGPAAAGGAADAGPIKGLPPGLQDGARQIGKILGIETP